MSKKLIRKLTKLSAMLLKLYRNFVNNFLFQQTINLSSRNNVRLFSTMKDYISQEKKININGLNINYLKIGTGDPVLLLPGAAGSIWTDFKPQIEGLDKEKFTIVAWDPPGYGKSRPPDRTYPDDFFQRDAIMACDLMKALGYTKFSLIGWSDGGITSLVLASMFPNNVKKMVALAANAYVTPEEKEIYKKYGTIDNWSEKMREPLINVYGEEYLRKISLNWLESILRICEKQNDDLCKESLKKIKCPSLIVQGNKDPMVLVEHASYLKDNIAGSKVKIFEKGAHNLHLRYSEEFNDIVTKFLIE